MIREDRKVDLVAYKLVSSPPLINTSHNKINLGIKPRRGNTFGGPPGPKTGTPSVGLGACSVGKSVISFRGLRGNQEIELIGMGNARK